MKIPISFVDLIREVQTGTARSRSNRTKHHDRVDARQLISRLSDIDRKILEPVANGVPNKSIAATMSLSLRTVDKYRHSLFKNLGVESAAEATRIWVLANPDD